MHLEAIRAGTRKISGEERLPVAWCSRVWCSGLLRGKRSEERSQSNRSLPDWSPVSGSPRMNDGC